MILKKIYIQDVQYGMTYEILSFVENKCYLSCL